MSLLESITHYPLGDSALVLVFGQTIAESTNLVIKRVCTSFDSLVHPAILEYVPAYTTITVYYDPLLLTYDNLFALIGERLTTLTTDESHEVVDKRIPVWYNGPDLNDVAEHTGLDHDTIVKMHVAPVYRVYMIGFVPGFPYLGGMDKRLATPRKKTPRLRIDAGSVGIAGEQTGVYPMETPGGWQIIGQTPLNLFDMAREQPSFLALGDRLRFEAIDEETFFKLKEQSYGF